MEANDMKAMREALVKIRDMIMGGGFDGRSPAYIVNICDSALAAPPRQCDVGTPEEKYQRWVHFCEQRLHSCHNCECNSLVGCTFKFGDMPYIKEGGEA